VYRAFDLEAAGAAELANTEEQGIQPAFAYSIEGGWQPPTPIKDRLSAGIDWASGKGETTAAFFPVTKETQGFVLEPGLSGIMIIKINYQARVLPSLSADLGGKYFFRNDSTSFTHRYLEEEENTYALGLELGGKIQWVPFSDLSFTVMGGVFLPGTGNAWSDSAPLLWRITAGTAFSF